MKLSVKDFDIDTNSKHLKSLCARHDPSIFVGAIANLLTYIGTPRIQIPPFQGLDSPLRQLTYLASLNLSADPDLVESTSEIRTGVNNCRAVFGLMMNWNYGAHFLIIRISKFLLLKICISKPFLRWAIFMTNCTKKDLVSSGKRILKEKPVTNT